MAKRGEWQSPQAGVRHFFLIRESLRKVTVTACLGAGIYFSSTESESVATDVPLVPFRTQRVELGSQGADFDAPRVDVDFLSADFDAQRAELDSLRAELDSLRVDIDSLRVDIDSLRVDIDSLKADLDATRYRALRASVRDSSS
jgi:peptidoglycan hydrolase CwlO-like protein